MRDLIFGTSLLVPILLLRCKSSKKYLRIYVSKSVSGHPLIIYVGDAMLLADCLVAAINIINFCVVFLRSICESRQSNFCVRPSSLLISVITQLSMFIAMSFTLSLSTSFLLGCTITSSYTFLSTVASMCCFISLVPPGTYCLLTNR